MLASVFASATACIIAAAREGGQVGVPVASLVLLNAGFALPVFSMVVTAETDLAAFATHMRRLATHQPPPPRRRRAVVQHEAHGVCGPSPEAASAASARGTVATSAASGVPGGTPSGVPGGAPRGELVGAPNPSPKPNPEP